MGEAKKRGTREQRIAAAAPKPRKVGAVERRAMMAEALTTAMAEVLVPVLAPVLKATRKGGAFH